MKIDCPHCLATNNVDPAAPGVKLCWFCTTILNDKIARVMEDKGIDLEPLRKRPDVGDLR